MDRELKNLTLNISQLAALSGVHRQTVINTDWGLPYLPRASMEQRKSELLEQRAEPVPSRSVPDGVNFLVATVDVQAGRHRRFVVQVPEHGTGRRTGGFGAVRQPAGEP
ncbi:TPA: hypothetical protein J1435_003899 [Escherichia coli]|nr:hypothetical protein [Escherichia coli]